MHPAATDATNHPGGRHYLRVNQVAQRLDVGKETVFRLIKTGKLPAFQLGGKGHTVRIREDEFEAWLDKDDAA